MKNNRLKVTAFMKFMFQQRKRDGVSALEDIKAGIRECHCWGMCGEEWKYRGFFYSPFNEKRNRKKASKSRGVKTSFYLKEVAKYKERAASKQYPQEMCQLSLSVIFIPGDLP